MLGANKMMIGLLLCVFGVLVIVTTHYTSMPDLVNLIAYGTIAVGGILFVLGLLYSMLHHGTGKKKGVHQDDTAISATALIRCMIATSIADGHLHDNEVTTIAKIYTQLTGSPMDENTIRETADHMEEEGSDILTELANIKGILDDNLKNKILKASLFILAADGVVEKDEEVILGAIRKGLGISKGKLKSARKKILTAKGLS